MTHCKRCCVLIVALDLILCLLGVRLQSFGPQASVSAVQVRNLPALKHLKLRGYMLTELAHLPASLESLDLGECKVTYEDEVALPGHLRLKQLALPQWGGKFSWMRAFPIPGI